MFLKVSLDAASQVNMCSRRLAPEFPAKRGVAFINGGNGSVYQSDIMKKTGFSKVKVSRVLDKLEQKGLLERKRRGMTNLVVAK